MFKNWTNKWKVILFLYKVGHNSQKLSRHFMLIHNQKNRMKKENLLKFLEFKCQSLFASLFNRHWQCASVVEIRNSWNYSYKQIIIRFADWNFYDYVMQTKSAPYLKIHSALLAYSEEICKWMEGNILLASSSHIYEKNSWNSKWLPFNMEFMRDANKSRDDFDEMIWLVRIRYLDLCMNNLQNF